jgi:hypothetical protein
VVDVGLMSRGSLEGSTVDVMTLIKSLVLASILALGLAACGGDGEGSTGDCIDLCTEAQAGDCTSVNGNCTSFCTALDGVQGPSNCTSQRNAYESCLEQGANVCDNDCAALESSLSNCVGTYCQANPTNADCQTLAASF